MQVSIAAGEKRKMRKAPKFEDPLQVENQKNYGEPL